MCRTSTFFSYMLIDSDRLRWFDSSIISYMLLALGKHPNACCMHDYLIHSIVHRQVPESCFAAVAHQLHGVRPQFTLHLPFPARISFPFMRAWWPC
jgi:hypothetical protein